MRRNNYIKSWNHYDFNGIFVSDIDAVSTAIFYCILCTSYQPRLLDHADATSVPAWLVVRVELWTNLVVCSVNVQEIVITPLRNRGYLRICLLFLSILISVHNLNFFSLEIYLPWPKGLMYSSYIIKCC